MRDAGRALRRVVVLGSDRGGRGILGSLSLDRVLDDGISRRSNGRLRDRARREPRVGGREVRGDACCQTHHQKQRGRQEPEGIAAPERSRRIMRLLQHGVTVTIRRLLARPTAE